MHLLVCYTARKGGRVIEFAEVFKMAYAPLAGAKSSVGIDALYSRAHWRSLEAPFLCLLIMVSRLQAPSGGRPS